MAQNTKTLCQLRMLAFAAQASPELFDTRAITHDFGRVYLAADAPPAVPCVHRGVKRPADTPLRRPGAIKVPPGDICPEAGYCWLLGFAPGTEVPDLGTNPQAWRVRVLGSADLPLVEVGSSAYGRQLHVSVDGSMALSEVESGARVGMLNPRRLERDRVERGQTARSSRGFEYTQARHNQKQRAQANLRPEFVSWKDYWVCPCCRMKGEDGSREWVEEHMEECPVVRQKRGKEAKLKQKAKTFMGQKQDPEQVACYRHKLDGGVMVHHKNHGYSCAVCHVWISNASIQATFWDEDHNEEDVYGNHKHGTYVHKDVCDIKAISHETLVEWRKNKKEYDEARQRMREHVPLCGCGRPRPYREVDGAYLLYCTGLGCGADFGLYYSCSDCGEEHRQEYTVGDDLHITSMTAHTRCESCWERGIQETRCYRVARLLLLGTHGQGGPIIAAYQDKIWHEEVTEYRAYCATLKCSSCGVHPVMNPDDDYRPLCVACDRLEEEDMRRADEAYEADMLKRYEQLQAQTANTVAASESLTDSEVSEQGIPLDDEFEAEIAIQRGMTPEELELQYSLLAIASDAVAQQGATAGPSGLSVEEKEKVRTLSSSERPEATCASGASDINLSGATRARAEGPKESIPAKTEAKRGRQRRSKGKKTQAPASPVRAPEGPRFAEDTNPKREERPLRLRGGAPSDQCESESEGSCSSEQIVESLLDPGDANGDEVSEHSESSHVGDSWLGDEDWEVVEPPTELPPCTCTDWCPGNDFDAVPAHKRVAFCYTMVYSALLARDKAQTGWCPRHLSGNSRVDGGFWQREADGLYEHLASAALDEVGSAMDERKEQRKLEQRKPGEEEQSAPVPPRTGQTVGKAVPLGALPRLKDHLAEEEQKTLDRKRAELRGEGLTPSEILSRRIARNEKERARAEGLAADERIALMQKEERERTLRPQGRPAPMGAGASDTKVSGATRARSEGPKQSIPDNQSEVSSSPSIPAGMNKSALVLVQRELYLSDEAKATFPGYFCSSTTVGWLKSAHTPQQRDQLLKWSGRFWPELARQIRETPVVRTAGCLSSARGWTETAEEARSRREMEASVAAAKRVAEAKARRRAHVEDVSDEEERPVFEARKAQHPSLKVLERKLSAGDSRGVRITARPDGATVVQPRREPSPKPVTPRKGKTSVRIPLTELPLSTDPVWAERVRKARAEAAKISGADSHESRPRRGKIDKPGTAYFLQRTVSAAAARAKEAGRSFYQKMKRTFTESDDARAEREAFKALTSTYGCFDDKVEAVEHVLDTNSVGSRLCGWVSKCYDFLQRVYDKDRPSPELQSMLDAGVAHRCPHAPKRYGAIRIRRFSEKTCRLCTPSQALVRRKEPSSQSTSTTRDADARRAKNILSQSPVGVLGPIAAVTAAIGASVREIASPEVNIARNELEDLTERYKKIDPAARKTMASSMTDKTSTLPYQNKRDNINKADLRQSDLHTERVYRATAESRRVKRNVGKAESVVRASLSPLAPAFVSQGAEAFKKASCAVAQALGDVVAPAAQPTSLNSKLYGSYSALSNFIEVCVDEIPLFASSVVDSIVGQRPDAPKAAKALKVLTKRALHRSQREVVDAWMYQHSQEWVEAESYDQLWAASVDKSLPQYYPRTFKAWALCGQKLWSWVFIYKVELPSALARCQRIFKTLRAHTPWLIKGFTYVGIALAVAAHVDIAYMLIRGDKPLVALYNGLVAGTITPEAAWPRYLQHAAEAIFCVGTCLPFAIGVDVGLCFWLAAKYGPTLARKLMELLRKLLAWLRRRHIGDDEVGPAESGPDAPQPPAPPEQRTWRKGKGRPGGHFFGYDLRHWRSYVWPVSRTIAVLNSLPDDLTGAPIDEVRALEDFLVQQKCYLVNGGVSPEAVDAFIHGCRLYISNNGVLSARLAARIREKFWPVGRTALEFVATRTPPRPSRPEHRSVRFDVLSIEGTDDDDARDGERGAISDTTRAHLAYFAGERASAADTPATRPPQGERGGVVNIEATADTLATRPPQGERGGVENTEAHADSLATRTPQGERGGEIETLATQTISVERGEVENIEEQPHSEIYLDDSFSDNEVMDIITNIEDNLQHARQSWRAQMARAALHSEEDHDEYLRAHAIEPPTGNTRFRPAELEDLDVLDQGPVPLNIEGRTPVRTFEQELVEANRRASNFAYESTLHPRHRVEFYAHDRDIYYTDVMNYMHDKRIEVESALLSGEIHGDPQPEEVYTAALRTWIATQDIDQHPLIVLEAYPTHAEPGQLPPRLNTGGEEVDDDALEQEIWLADERRSNLRDRSSNLIQAAEQSVANAQMLIRQFHVQHPNFEAQLDLRHRLARAQQLSWSRHLASLDEVIRRILWAQDHADLRSQEAQDRYVELCEAYPVENEEGMFVRSPGTHDPVVTTFNQAFTRLWCEDWRLENGLAIQLWSPTGVTARALFQTIWKLGTRYLQVIADVIVRNNLYIDPPSSARWRIEVREMSLRSARSGIPNAIAGYNQDRRLYITVSFHLLIVPLIRRHISSRQPIIMSELPIDAGDAVIEERLFRYALIKSELALQYGIDLRSHVLELSSRPIEREAWPVPPRLQLRWSRVVRELPAAQGMTARDLLLLAGDVELNPGPVFSMLTNLSIWQSILSSSESESLVNFDEIQRIESQLYDATIKVNRRLVAAFKTVFTLPITRLEIALERLYLYKSYLQQHAVYDAGIESVLADWSDWLEVTRSRVKPAWAPLLPVMKPKPLSRSWKIRLPPVNGEDGGNVLIRASYEDCVRWQAEKLAPALGMSVEDVVKKTEIQRIFDTNPYVDPLVQGAAERLGVEGTELKGMDGLLLATEETVWSSMQRYGPRNENIAITDEEIEELADCFFWRCPQMYAHNELTPAHKLIKNWKASPGYPLLFIKNKRSLRTWNGENIVRTMIKIATDTLGDDFVYERVSHVFPKSAIISEKKLLIDHKPIRTIIGADWINFIRGRVVNGEVNDRKMPWGWFAKPGMTMNGTAFDRLYQNAEEFKYHYSLDGSQFDSNVRQRIFHVGTRLRQLGFRGHPDQERLEQITQSIEDSVLKGHLVNMAADPESLLRHFYKEGGIQTGHESVTEDNCQALEVSLIRTLAVTWGMKFWDVFDQIWIDNIGDDNFLHTRVPIDREAFERIAAEETGTVFRFENLEGTELEIAGIVFLSKYGTKITEADRAELRSYGVDSGQVDSLHYTVRHVRDGILMKYTALRQDAHTRKVVRGRGPLGQYGRFMYLLQRLDGYLRLCAHHPDLFEKLMQEREIILAEADKRVRNGREHLTKDKRIPKVPTYQELMREWYAPMGPTQGNKNLVDMWTVYMDHINWQGYQADRLIRRVRSYAQTFDPEFWDLPEVPTDTLPNPGTWTPKFQVEKFIHLTFLERKWNDILRGEMKADGVDFSDKALRVQYADAGGSIPSDITHSELMQEIRMSPFLGQCDPENYLRSEDQSRKVYIEATQSYSKCQELVVRWRFRMMLLSWLYGSLTLVSGILPAGWLALGPLLYDTYNQILRRLFSWFSYAYWLDQGTGSAAISNLVPKDPYGVYKHAAVAILAKIPEWVALPDLLPFIDVRTGPVLNGIAEAILAGKGFFQKRVDGISDVSTNEKMLREHPWYIEMVACLNRLKATPDKGVLLDAPTASGKTYWFPQMTRLNHFGETGLIINLHIILVPTKILAQETSLPGLKWVRRGVELPTSGVVIMTYGHARAIERQLTNLDKDTTLFQLDEMHFETPEIVWMNAALKDHGYMRVMSTATPNFSLISQDFDESNVHKANVKGAFPVATIRLANVKVTNVVHCMLKSEKATRLGFNKRMLIIHPSITMCNRIKESLLKNKSAYAPDFRVEVLHSGQRVVPVEGHIVATQMVDAGVTIKGITCVIDSGLSIVNHLGTLQTVCVSERTRIQRKGRTGRTNIGVYISCYSGRDEKDAIQLPDIGEAIEYLDRWNSSGKYELQSDVDTTLRPEPGFSKLCSYVEVPDSLSGRYRSDILLWLRIAHTFSQEVYDDVRLGKVSRIYESLRAGKVIAEFEHLVPSNRRPAPNEICATDVRALEQLYHKGLIRFASYSGGWVNRFPAYQGRCIAFTGPTQRYLTTVGGYAVNDAMPLDAIESQLPIPVEKRQTLVTECCGTTMLLMPIEEGEKIPSGVAELAYRTAKTLDKHMCPNLVPVPEEELDAQEMEYMFNDYDNEELFVADQETLENEGDPLRITPAHIHQPEMDDEWESDQEVIDRMNQNVEMTPQEAAWIMELNEELSMFKVHT